MTPEDAARRERLRAEVRRTLDAEQTVLPPYLAEQHALPIEEVRDIVRDEEGRTTRRRLGRYEIHGRLGRGAMGVVYRAHDPALGRDVALKVLAPHLAGTPEAVERLRREAAAVAGLSHPSLVPVYEIGEEGGSSYFAMALIEGPTLDEWIGLEKEQGKTSLCAGSRKELVDFLLRFADVAEALDLAHEQGILHRDIKPSNVMLGEDGRLKLVDFGLVRDLGSETLTLEGGMLGTPMYMSPEQLTGISARLDRRSDVYSLGMTLYEALTFLPPHGDASLGALADFVRRADPAHPKTLGLSMPADLVAIVFKAIEKDPARRYPTAAAFAADLRSFVDYGPVAAGGGGPATWIRKFLLRRATAVRGAAVAIGALVAIGLGAWLVGMAKGEFDRRRADALVDAANASAGEAYRHNLLLPPADARAGWRQFFKEHRHTKWIQQARLRRAEVLEALEDRHEAKIWLAEAYLHDPEGETGIEALLGLARMFLEEVRVVLSGRALGVARALLGDRDRPELRLLEAEVALALGKTPEAVHHLERRHHLERLWERDAPSDVRARAAKVEEALLSHASRRLFSSLTAGSVVAGRFREEGRHVVVAGRGWTKLVRVDVDPPVEIPLRGIPKEVENSTLGAADFDGDGFDELIVVTRAHICCPEDAEHAVERLEIFDVRGKEAISRFHVAVPHAEYEACAGDYDHDGRMDLILAGSYPLRGLVVLHRGEGWAFSSAAFDDLGDLRRIHEDASPRSVTADGGATLHLLDPASDLRDARFVDLDGDGEKAFVLAIDQHRLYSLLVYRYGDDGRSFQEVFRRQVGGVRHLTVVDLDDDGRSEVVFGLGAVPMADAAFREAFLPQGVYVLDWREETGALEIAPLWTFRRFRLHSSKARQDDVTNVSFPAVVGGRGAAARPFLMGRVVHAEAGVGDAGYLALFDPRAPGERPILIGPSDSGAALVAFDLQGDGIQEILVPSRDGLLIYEAGPAPSPRPPRRRDVVQARREGLDLQFDLAQRMLDFELPAKAADQFRALAARPDVKGGAREEEAILGLVTALASRERYDEAEQVLQDACAERRGVRRRLDLELARIRIEKGEFSQAAEEVDVLATGEGLSFFECREAVVTGRWLAPWREVREETLPVPTAWESTDVDAFRAQSDGGVVLQDTQGRHVESTSSVPLPAGGFDLAFDVVFDAFASGQELRIGFLGPPPVDAPRGDHRGVYCHFGNTTGAGFVPALVVGRSAGKSAVHIPHPGEGLEPGVVYGVQIVCAGGGQRVVMRVTRPDGSCFAHHVLTDVVLPRPDADSPIRLGVSQGMTAGPGDFRLRIGNMSLWVPASGAR